MADEENANIASRPAKVAERLYKILQDDLKDRLQTIDDYMFGRHPDPYMPDTANGEYKLLAQRAVTNHCPLLVDTPGQQIYVDGFRRGRLQVSGPRKKTSKDRKDLPEWVHWQESRLDSRQDAIHRGALAYGHSFTLTYKDEDEGKVLTKGLSPLRTSALYEDPANDDNAVAVLHVVREPRREIANGQEHVYTGKALLWDRTNEYELEFGQDEWTVVGKPKPHGLDGENPVTRFAAAVDLDGRTVGVVEPYLRIQDRINQSVFDLLVAQSGESFETRTITGMAPPTIKKLDPDSGEMVDELDEWGNPVLAPIKMNAKTVLVSEDPDTKFGSLPGTPLAPYVEVCDLAIRHLSAVSQLPPHYLLGQIANLSAEALNAAETALARKVYHFKTVFGESWERVFRLALLLSGESGGDDMTGETIWRDMETHSISQVADALGKMRQNLQVPIRGLWPMIPGVSEAQLADWEDLYEEEETELGTIRPSGMAGGQNPNQMGQNQNPNQNPNQQQGVANGDGNPQGSR